MWNPSFADCWKPSRSPDEMRNFERRTSNSNRRMPDSSEAFVQRISRIEISRFEPLNHGHLLSCPSAYATADKSGSLSSSDNGGESWGEGEFRFIRKVNRRSEFGVQRSM